MTVKQAKEHCGYEAKPIRQMCANCEAFRSDFVIPEWARSNKAIVRTFKDGRRAKIEKNCRCADHGFSVKKQAVCRLWKPKEAAK